MHVGTIKWVAGEVSLAEAEKRLRKRIRWSVSAAFWGPHRFVCQKRVSKHLYQQSQRAGVGRGLPAIISLLYLRPSRSGHRCLLFGLTGPGRLNAMMQQRPDARPLLCGAHPARDLSEPERARCLLIFSPLAGFHAAEWSGRGVEDNVTCSSVYVFFFF